MSPHGLGKLERKLYSKMPAPIQRFWTRYHQTFKVAIFVMLFVGIAIIGLEARHASHDADKAKSEVKLITQNSPCTPIAGPGSQPVNPKQCAENYATGFKTLTPLQSCEFLQKGAGLIQIGNQPLPEITCNVPQAVQESREAGKAGKNGKLGNKDGSESRNLKSEGAASPSQPSEATSDSPAAVSPAAQSPGQSEEPSTSKPKPHHEPTQPQPQKPSQGSEPSPGQSSPESSSGAPPASSPGASASESSPVTEAPATEGSETPGGGVGPVGVPPARGGLEEVVGGLGHTTQELTAPLCETGLAGIKVCLIH